MEQMPPQSESRRLLLKYLAAGGLCTPFVPDLGGLHLGGLERARAADDVSGAGLLARVFASPPDTAGVGAYWYWLGGNVTREGITADLEAMRDAGISNPMLFAIGKSGKDTLVSPPADALTPLWFALLEHAVSEAERLGLVLSLNFCDGWATAAGPWITPELSMQRVVWAELTLEGGQSFHGSLPQPPVSHHYYREIAAVAFPWPSEWDETSFSQEAQVTTSLAPHAEGAARLGDPGNRVEVSGASDGQQPAWIEYAFTRPFTLRSITVRTPSPPGFAPGVYRAANSLEVQASDDGRTFRRIGALEYPRHGWQTDLTTLTHALPQTTARYFRLVHRPIAAQPYEEEYDFGEDTRLRLYSIVLSSEPRIHHGQGKSGAQWALSRRTTAQELPDSACVPLRDIVDLTPKIDSDGSLRWEVPVGRWRLLRIGYTTTGAQNSAAGGAQGLECDKFSPAAASLQFEKWFGVALQRVGPRLAGRVLHVLHVDSWEAGPQNWSPVFPDGFRKLRGYDLMPYLATMTGVPVASADISERVLLDVRRTINELMQTGFFSTVAALAHARGCLFSAEPPNPTFPADGMEHVAHVDMPMGEFWLNTPRNDKPTDIKDAVCGAHLYGKRLIGAEAFTEGLIAWDEHPFTLKVLGDHNYCEGINRLMLHVYAQQPWTDRAPGMTLNGIGAFFSRTQTWWQPGKAWLEYLRRCQALLQQGIAVADVGFFTGENLPARALLPRQLSLPLPAGYSYDSVNRDAILRHARVVDGQIVLQSGARYRVLVLPDEMLLTPEIATRLRELVGAGAVLVGRPPQQSPSLMAYPEADAIVRSVARDLWGDLDGRQRTERRFGAGRVIWGKSLEAVLRETGVAADVELRPAAEVSTTAAGGPIEWTHRRGDGWDLYFLSNPASAQCTLEASFRIRGRVPELWRPDAGTAETLALWREERERTVLPLSLDPGGSVFVVFARSAEERRSFAAIFTATDGGAEMAYAGDEVQLRERDGALEALVTRPGRWVLQGGSGGARSLAVEELPEPLTLTGPWRIRFAERLATPLELTLKDLTSWTEQADPRVKYFSGTALYTATFALGSSLIDPHLQLVLELGEVCNLAQVRLNGRSLGVLWKPPFCVDISRAARAGANRLELSVTNTWRNRLIGDHGQPEDQRVSFVVPQLRKGQPWLPGGPGAILSPAGLLGPVRITCAKVVLLGRG